MKISPWIGAVLLIVCLIAQWFFARYHVDPGNLLTTASGVAIAILLGQNFSQVQRRLERKEREVTMLRDSGRPGAVLEDESTLPPPQGPQT